jgi:UDP-glucose 4-epimerase
MNYVVTGGAGFIGSQIVKKLVDNGHFVTVIDNLHSGKLEHLTSVKNKIKFKKTDILNHNELEPILKYSDGIFHQAALSIIQESFEKEEEYFNVNINGTKNVFEIARKYDIRVIFASSSSVYGTPLHVPITENSTRKVSNPYAQTKLECEFLAEQYAKNGLDLIGLRYFNVYGIRQTSSYAGVITQFIKNLKQHLSPIINGDGSQIRDFIHVEDVANANLAAMDSSIKTGFFNVGTGNATSILQLAHTMIDISGLKLNPKFTSLPQGDVESSQADVTLSKNALCWKSSISLKQGLLKLFTTNSII